MDVFAIFSILTGFVFGSFLNVCIYRLPRQKSLVLPSSHCPVCGKAIKPYDNIPLLSFVLLGGKCRSCKTAISLQYPLVELLTGIVYGSCYFKWGLAPPAFLNAAFASALIVLIFIDYEHQILPNSITLPGAAIGIVLSPFQAPVFYGDQVIYNISLALAPGNPLAALSWVGSFLGVLVGGGVLLLVGQLYQMTRKKQGLGMGDVKMMAMVGAFIGWRLALVVIFAGSALGSVVGILLILFKGQTMQTKLAFGTFLGTATILVLFFGIPLIRWYSSIL
jgi:leader peptidase (prepilin peptidase)/N-methyltransferase